MSQSGSYRPAMLLLLRIRPAYLRVVHRQLSELLQREVQENPHVWFRLFLCLGDYDLILISNAYAPEDLSLGHKWLDGILGVREVPVCISTESQMESFRDLIESRLIVVTFAQLHPAANQSGGIFLEEALRKRLSELPGGFVVLPLYGIPELAVMAPWERVSQIPMCADTAIKTANEISKDESYPLLYRSLTLTCIDIDLVDNPQGADDTADCNADFQILMSVVPGYVPEIRRSVQETIKVASVDASWCAGLFDVVVSVPVKSTRDTCERINELLSLRKRNISHLLATSSTLSFPAAQRPGLDFPSKLLAVPTMHDLDPGDARLLIDVFGGLGRRLVKTMFNFNDLATNPLFSPAVLDMSLPVADLLVNSIELATLIRDGKEDRRPIAKYLEERLAPVHSGVDQRTIAAHASICPVESHARYLIGGVDRLLVAAQTIPLSLIHQSAGKHWMGYCVIGIRYPDFFHERLVIDIPPDALWYPENWGAIFHEAMHAYMETLRGGAFCQSPETSYGKILADIAARRPMKVAPGLAANEGLADEVVTDVLTMRCGPQWDKMLYFRSVWHYLLSAEHRGAKRAESKALFAAWFFRSTCTWLAWEDVSDGNRLSALGDSDWIRDRTKAMRQAFLRAGGELEEVIDQVDELKLLSDVQIYRNFAGLLDFAVSHSKAAFPAEVMHRRQEFFDGAAGTLIDAVRADDYDFGEEIEFPELLIWKLRKRVFDQENVHVISLERAAVMRLLVNAYWRTRAKILSVAGPLGSPKLV